MSAFTLEDYEHAARSVGLMSSGQRVDGKLFVSNDGGLNWGFWNPPEDDGDTLRLAVAIGVSMDLSGLFSMPHVNGVALTSSEAKDMKAIRDAIFRVAIAKGKAMKGSG